MLNNGVLNGILLNSGNQSQAQSEVLDNIIFNGYGLQNEKIVISQTNFRNLPKLDLLTYRNPKADGSGLLDRFYTDREVTFQGVIKGDDAEDLENRIDTFKQALSAKTGYLDFKVNGIYRRTLATISNYDIIDRKHYDITRAKFDISFKCLDPFFYEKDKVYKSFYNVTTNINEDVTNVGSIYSDPIINILINTTTGTTQIKAKVGTKQITINDTFSASDVIEIDCGKKSVTKNLVSIDYSGGFARLESGLNIFDLQLNGTFDVDVVILYRKNYL